MEVAILCGGEGKRMGHVNKGLLRICQKTFVETLYEELKGLGKVYIVGKSRDFDFLSILVHEDAVPDRGPMGGVYTALSISNSEYVLFVPCDMPLFKKEHAIYLEEMLLKNFADISVFYTSRIIPIPGIYHTSLKNTVKERLKSNNTSMINLIKTQKTVISVVRWLHLENVNTIEDYEKLLSDVRCS